MRFEAVFLKNGPDVRYLDGGLDDPSRLDPGRDEVAGILGGLIDACDDRTYRSFAMSVRSLRANMGTSVEMLQDLHGRRQTELRRWQPRRRRIAAGERE